MKKGNRDKLPGTRRGDNPNKKKYNCAKCGTPTDDPSGLCAVHMSRDE